MKDIYDKRKTRTIREYLGLSAEWCKDYFNEWKPDIFRAIDFAKQYNYEYILQSDYGLYTETDTVIKGKFNGIIVYEIIKDLEE